MQPHPPIPPNCEFITPCNWGGSWPADLWKFKVGGESYAFGPVLCGHEEDDKNLIAWSKVVASVARCAWMDESARILDVSPCKTIGETKACVDAMAECDNNAAAWAKWQRGLLW